MGRAYGLAISLLKDLPREVKTCPHSDLCLHVPNAVCVINENNSNWKQLKCPSTGNQVNMHSIARQWGTAMQ